MALTKVTGQVINTSTDVTVGVLTVTNTLAVGGTVSIGGTLTYEDVTNIDSVGLITARNGIVVGSGITLSKDGDVFFTGIATGNGSGLTALNASNIGSGTVPTARLGSGTASSSTFLRGDSTFQTVNTDLVSDTSPQLGGDLDTNGNNINFGDSGSSSDDRLVLGSDSDFEIYHTGSGAYIQNKTGTLFIGSNFDDDDGGDIRIQPKYGENSIVAYDDGPVELYYDNSRVFETDSASVKIRDNIKAKFGTGDDIQLYHDGSNSYFLNSTGFLNIKTTGGGAHYIDADDQYFRTSGGENLVRMIGDGAVELYHDNVKQIQTTANGVGFVNNCTFSDSKKIQMGDANDLQLYHDGSNSISFIDTTNGNLRIRVANGENAIQCKANNAVELYHNNTKRIETTANGIEVTGAGTGNYFNAGANALNTTFQSNYGGAGATSVIRVKMNTSSVHGIQIQQAGSSTSVAGGNHAATFFNTENAKLRLGTNNGEQFRIENNGDLKANDTSIGSLSDSRLKKNIVDFTYDLNKFKQFKPKTFDWINPELHGNKSNVRGFVAQEIEVVDSTLVGDYELYDETLTDKNPDLAIIKADDGTNIAKDSKLGTNDAMYISVIQQLMTKIETLETSNTDLKNLIKNSSSFAALKSSL